MWLSTATSVNPRITPNDLPEILRPSFPCRGAGSTGGRGSRMAHRRRYEEVRVSWTRSFLIFDYHPVQSGRYQMAHHQSQLYTYIYTYLKYTHLHQNVIWAVSHLLFVNREQSNPHNLGIDVARLGGKVATEVIKVQPVPSHIHTIWSIWYYSAWYIICMYIYIHYIYTYIYMCVYVYCICIYVCVYIYISCLWPIDASKKTSSIYHHFISHITFQITSRMLG